MQSAARKKDSAPAAAAKRAPASPPSAKPAKLSVYLVTRDDMLWPQVGSHIPKRMVLKQVDSIDELLGVTTPGQSAIVLWDARSQGSAIAALSRIASHSTRFAAIALDAANSVSAWAKPLELRQIVAHLELPIGAAPLSNAIEAADQEIGAREALLGKQADASIPAPGSRRVLRSAALGLAALAAIAGYYLSKRETVAPPPRQEYAATTPGKPPAATDEKVDVLVEQAQQAMLDRHFIDPAQGSALSLYRNALLLDPANGEAQQGLQRLAEILFNRVQSSLDERKFDVALQSLESARSINPGDLRLGVLDERIATLRAEVGPAQILAAITAQNFERASQLIDEATLNKSLSAARLAQLREELRRRHDEAAVADSVKLIDSRLQLDRVTEPREDSAVYYLAQARAAGAPSSALQPQYQEIYKRLSQSLRTPLEQSRWLDADRLLGEWQSAGVPASMMSNLQHEAAAARTQQAASAAAAEFRQYLDLAQLRLAQGKSIEPENDSALYYLNHLLASDPKNPSLPALTGALQAQLVQEARSSLDAGQPARAESLLRASASLGSSSDADALSQRLAQLKVAAARPSEVPEASLTRLKGIVLQYPLEARTKGLEGWVEVSYAVAVDGRVSNVKVTNSSPAGVFDQAAIRAITRLRYEPPTQGAKPVAVTTGMHLTFRLAN